MTSRTCSELITAHRGSPPPPGGDQLMPTTVEAATDTGRETDAETPAEKSAITLNYEEMLAALNGLLAEMREERRQTEASGSLADAQHAQEPATAQASVWAEAHAALSQK